MLRFGRTVTGLLTCAPLMLLLSFEQSFLAATAFGAQEKASPYSAQELAARKSASKLLKEGRFDEALARAKEVSKQFNCPEFYYSYRGSICVKGNDYQGAVDAYDAYLRLVPNGSIEAARNKALACIGLQSFTSLWSNSNPKYKEIECRLAKSKQCYLFYYAAEEYLKEHPDDQRVMVFLADRCVRGSYTKRLSELMPRIDPKLRDDKQFLEVEVMVGSGATKEAIPVITRMLHRKRDCGHLYALLSWSLGARKRNEEARKALAKARALAPDSPRLEMAEGICLVLEKKYELALARFDQYLETDLSDPSANWRKVEVLLLLGREKEAGEIMEKVGMTKVGTAEYFEKLADLYSGILKPREALRCLDRAIELEPRNSWHYYKRAREEAEIWLFPESLDDCKIALKLDPKLTRAKVLKTKCENEIARAKEPGEGGIKDVVQAAATLRH